MEQVPVPPARWWPPRGANADRLVAAGVAGLTVVDVIASGFQPAMSAAVAWGGIHPLRTLVVVMGGTLLLNGMSRVGDEHLASDSAGR